MRIAAIEDTDLFLGPDAAPRQVVRVTLTTATPTGPVRLRVEGPTVRTPEASATGPLAAGEERVVEVGVHVAAPASEGSVHRITVIAESETGRVTAEGRLRAAATGWTMWMISHFHYDPVWWNTQRGFTEVWQQLPDVPKADKLRPAFVRTAFDLVRAHLDAARLDEDYRFVLAEIDYLKPYWDVYPEDRDDMRRMLREGRVELVGGMYNEPNTNLTHPESTIRNTALGVAYQRDVLGGDPQSAWMLDVFGHDPAFPGLMADAGLTSSSWARGPFHHIGAKRHTGDIERMQFPSEFEWISPTGRGVLTAYMANHYVAGWDVERKSTLDEAMAEAYAQYRELKKVSATRNAMLPVGHDHNIPSKWCTEIHREWPKRYAWPKFRMGLPRDFFDAVRAENVPLSPQTRDMNPVYTGKDVSYIDTKQAQRAIETVVLDAERLGTLAGLFGTAYPADALEKAWRLLAYGAHHDAVTGTESDQVYLDLLAGWREAYEIGASARRGAIEGLAAAVDTAGEGRAVLVTNSLSWERDGIARVSLTYPAPGPSSVTVLDETGTVLPSVVEGAVRHPDGTLAAITLAVAGQAVPALGYRVWRVVEATAASPEWVRADGPAVIRNEVFEVRAASSGALTSIVDLRSGRELLRPGGVGGEIVVQDEYADHPFWGEGPWHLLPKGPGVTPDGGSVRAESSAAGSRLVSTVTLDELTITREVILWHGSGNLDFRTHVDGSIGQDRLLRVRFDLDLPGALPVSDVGFAAIGRSFGFPELDAAESLWTLDNPAHTWAGLSATARLRLGGPAADGSSSAAGSSPDAAGSSPDAAGSSPDAAGDREIAIGVAEVIGDGETRELLVALARQGVTATSTKPGGQRYGSLDGDSNLPDVRILIGSLDEIEAPATGWILLPATRPRAEVWEPDADLRGMRDLPLLVVAPDAVDALIADLADAVVEVTGVVGELREPAFTGYSAALVNHGTPGFVASHDGSLYLSLMRACSGWPSGVWIDGPQRFTPDGAGFALQHWSHTFRYSLVAGDGDWRRAGFVRAGQELNHPLTASPVASTGGELPSRASLGAVEPSTVVLTALKPRPAGGVAVRVYESTGAPATARISLHGGLAEPVTTNVLEEPHPGGSAEPHHGGAPRAGADGADVVLAIAPADVVTVAARPSVPVAPVFLAEPVQPVFTRYWMHNKGPAPLGDMPVSVHVDPSTFRITLASSTAAHAGTLEIETPDGVTSVEYSLAAGGHRFVEPPVTGRPAYVSARIRDPYGQILEDTALGAEQPALVASLAPAAVTVAPGASAVLTLHVQNPAGIPVRGEAQLLTPFGTWGDTSDDLSAGPWIQGYALPPGESTTLEFTVTAPAHARPGARWWALARLAALGNVTYTATIPLAVEA
ncbi:glycoside hydrolase family 38 C-terminal domain-containing protein [Actinoplanes sp. NPDC051851]|uniref:glycoside hydrolase family 38 N-terminal domain-containing protein n=1 Tax=Actinoplanes sp. NPDC051851 TaxID=3154753 RepID=UPI0034435219